VGAIISAMGERNTGGIKTSLVIAAVGGVAWLLAQANGTSWANMTCRGFSIWNPDSA